MFRSLCKLILCSAARINIFWLTELIWMAVIWLQRSASQSVSQPAKHTHTHTYTNQHTNQLSPSHTKHQRHQRQRHTFIHIIKRYHFDLFSRLSHVTSSVNNFQRLVWKMYAKQKKMKREKIVRHEDGTYLYCVYYEYKYECERKCARETEWGGGVGGERNK